MRRWWAAGRGWESRAVSGGQRRWVSRRAGVFGVECERGGSGDPAPAAGVGAQCVGSRRPREVGLRGGGRARRWWALAEAARDLDEGKPGWTEAEKGSRREGEAARAEHRLCPGGGLGPGGASEGNQAWLRGATKWTISFPPPRESRPKSSAGSANSKRTDASADAHLGRACTQRTLRPAGTEPSKECVGQALRPAESLHTARRVCSRRCGLQGVHPAGTVQCSE